MGRERNAICGESSYAMRAGLGQREIKDGYESRRLEPETPTEASRDRHLPPTVEASAGWLKASRFRMGRQTKVAGKAFLLRGGMVWVLSTPAANLNRRNFRNKALCCFM